MCDEVADLAVRSLRVLSARPAGLLTDIDGTICLIAPTPDAVAVAQDVRDAMKRLARRLDVVGAVTGRTAENAEALVAVPELIYVGNHGLEWRRGGVTRVNPSAEASIGTIAGAIDAVKSAATRLGLTEGIIYENKGVTGSIHYRLAKDQARAHRTLLPLVQAEAAARGLKVTEGRMVIEIRPILPINKGTAVTSIVESERLGSLIFLGDDITDIDAFRALARLRDERNLLGLNIAVVAPESSPAVAAAADAAVQGVECCAQLLTAIADGLENVGEVDHG